MIPVARTIGDLYVPDEAEGTVNQYSSTGFHERDNQRARYGHRHRGRSEQRGPLRQRLQWSHLRVFGTSGSLINSFGTESAGATGLAVNSSGKVYVVNGGGYGAKGTAQIYSSSGSMKVNSTETLHIRLQSITLTTMCTLTKETR